MNVYEENIAQIETMQKNLKALREERNWSVERLSSISGIKTKDLIGIEAGVNSKICILFILCDIYGIKPHQIFYPIVHEGDKEK